jgi:hypothetical protein
MFHLKWAITRLPRDFWIIIIRSSCPGALVYSTFRSLTVAHLNWEILLSYMPITTVGGELNFEVIQTRLIQPKPRFRMNDRIKPDICYMQYLANFAKPFK